MKTKLIAALLSAALLHSPLSAVAQAQRRPERGGGFPGGGHERQPNNPPRQMPPRQDDSDHHTRLGTAPSVPSKVFPAMTKPGSTTATCRARGAPEDRAANCELEPTDQV